MNQLKIDETNGFFIKKNYVCKYGKINVIIFFFPNS